MQWISIRVCVSKGRIISATNRILGAPLESPKSSRGHRLFLQSWSSPGMSYNSAAVSGPFPLNTSCIQQQDEPGIFHREPNFPTSASSGIVTPQTPSLLFLSLPLRRFFMVLTSLVLMTLGLLFLPSCGDIMNPLSSLSQAWVNKSQPVSSQELCDFGLVSHICDSLVKET